MRKKYSKRSDLNYVKDRETLCKISRDIFFDLYLEDIFRLVVKVTSGLKELKRSSQVGSNLAVISRSAVSLIKNVEAMVEAKVMEEELASQRTVEEAKNILIKDLGLSEDIAMKRIREESRKSCKSMCKIGNGIILAEDFRKN